MSDEQQQPAQDIVPPSSKEAALSLATTLRAKAEQRIGYLSNQIITQAFVEMYVAGYVAALQDNGLLDEQEPSQETTGP